MKGYLIIRGPLAVGKTTIAKALTKKLNGKYISADKALDKVGWKESKDGFIAEESFLKANTLIIPAMKKSLSKGKITILDGNFYRKTQLLDILKKVKSKKYIFTLKASVNECIKRDKERKISLGKDAVKVVHKIVSKLDYGIVINTNNRSVEETMKEVISYLPKK